MSLKRNPEILLPLLVGVRVGPPRLQRREVGKGQRTDIGKKRQRQRGQKEASYHLAGLQGSCSQPPGHQRQEPWVRRNWGPVTSLPSPCQSSPLRLRLKVRSPGPQFCDSAVISQPGKRYPQGRPHLVQGGGGRQAERECQRLIINGFFYFYWCSWQWAEGTQ